MSLETAAQLLSRPLSHSVSAVLLCFLGSHIRNCGSAHNSRAAEQRKRRAQSRHILQEWTRWMQSLGQAFEKAFCCPVGMELHLVSGQPVALRFFEHMSSFPNPVFPFSFPLLVRPVGLTPDCTIQSLVGALKTTRGSDSSGLGGI